MSLLRTTLLSLAVVASTVPLAADVGPTPRTQDVNASGATLTCIPFRACLLQLPESRVSVVAGDTVRWVIHPTNETALTIKPNAWDLRTNLVVSLASGEIVTLELVSPPEEPQPRSYDALTRVLPHAAPLAIADLPPTPARTCPDRTPFSPSHLNLDYSLERSRSTFPSTPLRVLDDGEKTYLRLAPKAAIPVIRSAENAPILDVSPLEGGWVAVPGVHDTLTLELPRGKKVSRLVIRRGGAR